MIKPDAAAPDRACRWLLAEQMGGAAGAAIHAGLLEIRVELPLAARTL
ncbi:hypothetical protein [Paenibacillus typhae]